MDHADADVDRARAAVTERDQLRARRAALADELLVAGQRPDAEAQAAVDRMIGEAARLDIRLQDLGDVDAALTAARAARRAAARATGAGDAAELARIDTAEARVAADLARIAAALAAGEQARAAISAVREVLIGARHAARADLWGRPASTAKRAQLDVAVAQAQAARPALRAFAIDLAPVGEALSALLATIADRWRAIDVFIDDIGTDLATQHNIDAALATVLDLTRAIDDRVAELVRQRGAAEVEQVRLDVADDRLHRS